MPRIFSFFALFALVFPVFSSAPATAALVWDWDFSGAGIQASGTLTTVETPDGDGAYLITSIAGERNGDPITGLQPAGTAVPGNEPYAVDDLLFAGPGPQLTGNGFGFSTSAGNYSNPFWADFLPTPGYLEFFSSQPGTPEASTTELPVAFSATIAPEPATSALLSGVLALAVVRRRIRPRR